MIDILFDFSVSNRFGGLKRLEAYMRYFENSNMNVKFLINPRNVDLAKKYKIYYDIYRRSILSRLLPDIKLSKIYKNKVRVYYSYGIPISAKIGKINHLHLTNALPFDYEKCQLSFSEYMKNVLLRILFTIYKKHNSLSAESEYTIKIYKNKIKWKGFEFISQNGIDELDMNTNENIYNYTDKYNKYMMTIGTERYKRIDKVVEIFKNIKKEKKIDKLIIVGKNKRYINKYFKKDNDIIFLGEIDRSYVIRLLKKASAYITCSEIENSSNAFIEALKYCSGEIIFSNIESHNEIINTLNLDKIIYIWQKYYAINNSCSKKITFKDWNEVVGSMINNIYYRYEI